MTSTPPAPTRSGWSRAAVLPLVCLIHAYRFTLGPLLGGQCRFYPTCSQYALDAYARHGAVRGTWLTVRRLGRCHPLCKGGVDLVPERLPSEQRKTSAQH